MGLTALGLYITGLLLYYAYTLQIERLRYLNLFVGPGIALFYIHTYRQEHVEVMPERELSVLSFPAGLDADRFPLIGRAYTAVLQRADVVNLLFAVLALVCTVYIEIHFERLRFEAPITGTTAIDQLVGLLLIVIVIHATKVAYGWAISLATVAAIVYALAGPLFPGIFHHTGMNLSQLAVTSAIGLRGIFGFIMAIGATWVAVFIVFAGIAKSFGLIDYILSIGEEASKLFRSGIVHAAVVSSLFIGSLTGSAAANTATTGSFTIPMMSQQGVDDEYAAAIESVASSGAQVMPPVMGVAAFLMADILGVSYFVIIRAGIIPALIFYFSAMLATHLLILRYGWTAAETGRFDRSVLLKGVHFLAPLTVLIYTLVVMRLTPLGAGLYTILTLVATMYVRNLVVDGVSVSTILGTTKQTIVGLKQGAVEMAPLVGILASLGVVINMLTQTGLTQKISAQMIALSGGVFVILLLLAMITSILFGLGMPTPAAYILVVVLVAPAMIQYGVAEIASHMFVFYFAMLSAITPPVAISVAIGSKIAGSGFLQSCKQALRIGAPGFVIPFAFITNESLIYWAFPDTLIACVLVFTSIGALVIAMTRFNGKNVISRPSQLGYLVLSVIGMMGPFTAQVAAVAIIALLFANTYLRPLPKSRPVADD